MDRDNPTETFPHRVFDRVINDQVVVAEREPWPHSNKISVLQRVRRFPYGDIQRHTHTRLTLVVNCSKNGRKLRLWSVHTNRSNIPRRRWPSAEQYHTCRSCWCPTSCGSSCHAGHHRLSLPSHPYTQSSSVDGHRKDRNTERTEEKETKWGRQKGWLSGPLFKRVISTPICLW